MRTRIRALLLLPLLGAIVLEAVALLRPPLAAATHRAYPEVGIDEDGRLLHYDVQRERAADDTVRTSFVLDAERSPPELLGTDPARAVARLVLVSSRLPPAGPDFDDPRFLMEYLYARERSAAPLPPLEHMATHALDALERSRRELDYEIRRARGDVGRPSLGIEWRAEDGRLVCRETATGRVVAGLGPDGYARGEGAAAGERFGRLDAGPIATPLVRTEEFRWVLLETEGRRVHVVTFDEGAAGDAKLPPDSLEPVALEIETSALRPLGETFDPDSMPFCRAVGRDLLVFLSDGSVIGETTLEAGERFTTVHGALLVWADGYTGSYMLPSRATFTAVGVETALPCAPDAERRRVRLYRPGRPDAVRDIVLEPTRTGEVFLANLTAALALVRPPPLSIASALSDPGDSWWWRDPWLAAGGYPGWLVLSLALAAFLAWRARRKARERCATAGEARSWTAAVFLLGPVGLLWMRFVLPRVPVESVGAARRAVNLDASPTTAEPWPEPRPQGIEVFQ